MSFPNPQQIQQTRPAVAQGSKPCTPSGGTNVVFTSPYPDAIRVDGAGAVAFVTLSGDTDTWTCVAGDIIPVVVKQVIAAGTTATGLHALYTAANQ